MILTLQHIIILSVVIFMLVAFLSGCFRAYAIMLLALLSFIFLGHISINQALSSFFNETVWTIGLLLIITSPMKHNKIIQKIVHNLLTTSRSLTCTVFRIMLFTSGCSAFINNTPIVFTLAPIIKNRLPQYTLPYKKLLIPLTFAASLGGMCTSIGTSTNIVVSSLMKDANMSGLSIFTLAIVGVPCAIFGIIYMSLIGIHLIPGTFSDHNITLSPPSTASEENSKSSKLSTNDVFYSLMFLAVIIIASLGVLPLPYVALPGVIVLLLMNYISVKEAVHALEWRLLLTIGASLGISKALENSDIMTIITNEMIQQLASFGSIFLLAAVYLLTWLSSELITNTASAVLIFPISYSIAEQASLNPEPFAIAVAIAASANFATPIGYQTNLYVYELGGYSFYDFIRTGIPLTLLCMLISITIIPLVWPLQG